MTTPVRITVNGHRVFVGPQAFAFSSQAAAAQAQCTLREPLHIPRGGNKFDKQDVGVFAALEAAFKVAQS